MLSDTIVKFISWYESNPLPNERTFL